MHIIIEKKSLNPQEDCAEHSMANIEQWHSPSLAAPISLMGHTESVLDDAWNLYAQGHLPVWGTVLAKSQKAGRGQTRRYWHSPEGNLYMAIRLPAEGLFATTAAAPVFSTLVLLALQNLGYSLQLKWPNDLVLSLMHYKVGGILLEEKQGCLVAGMGINVQQAPGEHFLRENHALKAGILPPIQGLKDSISIQNSNILPHELTAAEALCLHLVSQIYFWYKEKLLTDTSERSWTSIAETFLLWKGQEVELTDGQESLQGILHGLGSQGEIILNIRGHLQQCISGSLRLKG